MKPTVQMRIRVQHDVAEKYMKLPPRLRARAFSFILAAQECDIDLKQLLQLRGTLISLGVLINQSLKTSWGKTTDTEAVRQVVQLLKGVLR